MLPSEALYPYTAKEARERGELELWRANFRTNCACAGAIELAIRKGFDGMHLSTDCAKSVIDQYGYKRVGFVLANTLQEQSYDGRYYGQNTPPRQPLTQRKEFRSLKNWIIREAEDISFSPSADSVEPGEKQSTEKTPPIRGSADVQPVGEAVSARHIPANAVMRLLHHMGQIFRTSMPVIPPALRIDSKRRRRLQEKRMAMGHKRNDHEDEQLHHVNDNTMR